MVGAGERQEGETCETKRPSRPGAPVCPGTMWRPVAQSSRGCWHQQDVQKTSASGGKSCSLCWATLALHVRRAYPDPIGSIRYSLSIMLCFAFFDILATIFGNLVSGRLAYGRVASQSIRSIPSAYDIEAHLVSKPSRPPSARVFKRSFWSCLAASECPELASEALRSGSVVRHGEVEKKGS